MAATPNRVGAQALAVIEKESDEQVLLKPAKKILEEEAFSDSLEKIIVRDFYPDLPKLEAQNEYLEALEKNDVVKLREIHIKYGPKRPSAAPNIYATPATFETPDVNSGSETPQVTATSTSKESGRKASPTHNPEPVKEKLTNDLPLDKFLSKVTSEDNASFADIMEESEKKRKIKNGWLYEQEEQRRLEKVSQLALPGIEQQALMGSNEHIESWEYTNQNTVMYNPDGAKLSAKEIVESAKGNPREIVHKNTRYVQSPFDQKKIAEMTAQTANMHAHLKLGKIGHDGKELLPADTPQMNGYGFVSATPSPAPGVDESPLMTWGEIDGTPFRLDGSNTPAPNRTPGPTFRMPAVPRRDEIAHELLDKVNKAHRAKKEAALKRVSSRLNTASPRFSPARTRTDRIQNMSPAAQRLASSKLGIRTNSDKALRASYTPSPSQRLGRTRTPNLVTPKKATPQTHTTPSQSPRRTPRTPGSQRAELNISLTDNLLNLPKRPRAEDFF